jgi:6-phosphogluconolactonase (cycloisomerase 2 family)
VKRNIYVRNRESAPQNRIHTEPIKSYTRRFVGIVGISFALLGGSLRAEFAYGLVGDGVSAYRIAENGSLTLVAGSSLPTGNPISVAVDPLGLFVYVANFYGSNSVSAFRIGEGGFLTPVPGSPFPAGNEPTSVAVDLLGRFVYVANDGGFPSFNGSVSAYRIAENGSLTAVPGSRFPRGAHPVPSRWTR